ncbi:hypothetical protein APSETT445_004884 [Aspergillus pseudonomiae]
MSYPGSGEHVLLTGANGFVASHILAILLEGPFNALFEDIKVPFNYIIHTASPLNFNVKDIQKEMIEPAVMGTTQILESAHCHGGTALKRFVLLGSAVSVLNSFEDMSREGRPYTEQDWNPVTATQAIERQDTVLGYNVCKTMGTEKLQVDVRDVARSHVDALTNPAAGGKRILLISGLITPQLVVNIIRKHFLALKESVPEGKPEQVLPDGVHPTGWDMRVSLDVLSKGTSEGRWEYIDLDKSVTDAVQSMIDHNVV